MKKPLLFICLLALLVSCNRGEKATSTTAGNEAPTDLPYNVSYSSSWSDNISDEDLELVLMSYKDWASGNMAGLGNAMGDSVEYDMNTGKRLEQSRAQLMDMWTTSRDSLKSVSIDMQAWNRMYATDKKDAFIVTWYKEIDTYKDGRVDSAYYHDINQVKDGKIVWYSQYKRPAK